MGDEYKRLYLTHTLTLDIETASEGEKLTVEELMPLHPKTMTKEDTIRKWAEENIDSEYESRALNRLKGRIICISVKWDDEPSKIITYNESEEFMLKELAKELEDHKHIIYSCAIVGNRIKEFDCKWILQGAFKYNVKDLIRLLPTDQNDKRLQDLSKMFNQYEYGAHTSVDDMCKFLGIESPKEKMDGSMVGEYFRSGRLDEIYKYCMLDTDKEYEIYLRMLP